MRVQGFLFILLLLPSFVVSAEIRFESPESALAYYIKAANAHDLSGINTTFLDPTDTFNFPDGPPVERFSVVKRIRYTEKDVLDWNRKGIAGPAPAVGDLELHVREVIAGKSFMYSYQLRDTGFGWKIVDFYAWDQ